MSLEYFLNEFMDDEFSNTMFTMENKIKETGIAEGKIAEKLEIAKSMLDKNYGIQEIIGLTGLSKKELKKLKKEMQKEITV